MNNCHSERMRGISTFGVRVGEDFHAIPSSLLLEEKVSRHRRDG